MLGIAKASLAGSSYIFGVATGVAVAIPLAAGAFTTDRSLPAPQAILGPAVAGATSASIAASVNRTAKGPRLDVRIPTAQNVPAVAGTHTSQSGSIVIRPTVDATSPDAASKSRAAPVPAADSRSMPSQRTPAGSAPAPLARGCLSALGGLRPNIPTDNLTVCMANLSDID